MPYHDKKVATPTPLLPREPAFRHCPPFRILSCASLALPSSPADPSILVQRAMTVQGIYEALKVFEKAGVDKAVMGINSMNGMYS